MNKLLNNLLGMYKQAKLNKKAEEDLIEVGWGLYTNDEYEIKDNALYGDDKPQEVNETFWNKINNEIDKVESWFLKEGYKKFFTKVRDEGHGKDSELGGTAWMTENQLKDFMANAEQWDTEFVLAESSGTLDFGNIPVDYNEALSFKLKIYVDDKDLDELGIESKRVSKNKKLSSKNTKLTKKAGWKVLTPKDLTEEVKDEFLKDSIKEYAGHVKREDFYFVKGIKEKEDDQFSYEWEEGMFGEWGTNVKGEKWYSLTDLGDDWDYIYLIKEDKLYKMPKRESLTDFGVVSSKAKDMRKKAEYTKKDYLNHFRDIKQDVLFDNKGNFVEAVKDLLGFASSEYDKARFPREDVYNLVKEYIDDTINFQEMINHPIKEEYIVKAKELLNKYKVENKIANSIKTLHKKSENFDEAEEFAKKIIEENKYAFSGHTDMAKLENNAYSMFLMDNASIKEILDEAKKIVSELDNDKDKKLEDADLYFGMKDRALLAEKVLEEKTKQEKQSSKSNRLQKKAKIVLEQIGNEYYLDGKKGDYSDFNYDGKYKQTNYNVFVDDKGKTHKVWEFEGTLDKQTTKKQAKIELIENVWYKIFGYPLSLKYLGKDKGGRTRWEKADGTEVVFDVDVEIEPYEYSYSPFSNDKQATKKQAEKVLTLKEAIGKDESEFKNMEDIVDYMNHLPLNANKNSWTVEGFGGNSIDVENLSNGEKATIKLKKNFNSRYATRQNKLFKSATIKHENGVYNVYSESGKCLGKGYKTKEEAEKRLKQVEYFKNKKAVTGTDYWGPKEIPDEEEEGTFIIKYYGGPGHIDYLRKSRNGKYHWVEQTHFDYINDKPFETTDYELAKKLVEQYGGEIEKKESKQVNNKRTSLKQVVISKMAKIKK